MAPGPRPREVTAHVVFTVDSSGKIEVNIHSEDPLARSSVLGALREWFERDRDEHQEANLHKWKEHLSG